MIIFNQADTSLSSLTMTNEDSSYPITNAETRYAKQVAKSTTTSTTISFTFTGRDLVFLNTNATSGSIFADYSSASSSTISTNTTYTTDTILDGVITVADGVTVGADDGVIVTVSQGVHYSGSGAIDFDIGLLKTKDLYFDLGSSQTWTVDIELSGSANIEIGAIVCGDFVQYGYGTELNRKVSGNGAKGSFLASMSSHEALRDAVNDYDFFAGIPNRDLTNAGIFVGYGKITIKEFKISGESQYFDGEQYETAEVEFD